jgi:hypothetical protein
VAVQLPPQHGLLGITPQACQFFLVFILVYSCGTPRGTFRFLRQCRTSEVFTVSSVTAIAKIVTFGSCGASVVQVEGGRKKRAGGEFGGIRLLHSSLVFSPASTIHWPPTTDHRAVPILTDRLPISRKELSHSDSGAAQSVAAPVTLAMTPCQRSSVLFGHAFASRRPFFSVGSCT